IRQRAAGFSCGIRAVARQHRAAAAYGRNYRRVAAKTARCRCRATFQNGGESRIMGGTGALIMRSASSWIIPTLIVSAAAVALVQPGFAQNAGAQNNRSAAQPIPEPPPPPPGFELDPAAEPQVTIRKRGEDTVEEYRIS